MGVRTICEDRTDGLLAEHWDAFLQFGGLGTSCLYIHKQKYTKKKHLASCTADWDIHQISVLWS